MLVTIAIPQVWEAVEKVRRQVEETLATYPSALRVSAIMSASELTENAIKYGEPVAALVGASFSMTHSEQMVRLVVQNGVTCKTRVDKIAQTLSELRSAESAEAAYLARLNQMIDEPLGNGSQLGLLRIAYEGRFSLHYEWQNEVLTMSAVRRT